MPQVTTCTNCQGEVHVRRPSHSGNHYCAKPECQSAKQKFYRNRRAAQADLSATEERLELLAAVVNGQRTACPRCGLEDALPGWAHRNETGLKPCFGVGAKGTAAGVTWLDVVHPDRVPVPE